MMSRNDLTRIQQQLKEAIQAHQALVSKLKGDPNNSGLKMEMRKKQVEISSLCAKQKQSIQLVHEELLVKRPPSTASNEKSQAAAASKTIDAGDSTASQAGGKKSSAVLKVPQFHASVPTVAIPASRPTLLQTKEILQKPVSALGPAPAVSCAPSAQLSAAGSSSSSIAPSPVNGLTDTPGNVGGAYSRLIDTHFVVIGQNTLKRATSPAARLKLEFLAAVDLIPTEAAIELQRKRTERKRRTTANPQFSYQDSQAFEAKKHVYLSNASAIKRPRGRPPARPPLIESRQGAVPPVVADDAHDDFCAICRRSGELLLCDTCNLVYHLECLNPPLSAVPDGNWSCPKCIALRKPLVGAPGSNSTAARVGSSGSSKATAGASVVAQVQAFIDYKAAKEEEKLILLKHNAELSTEKQHLEARADHLTDAVAQQLQRKSQLRAVQAESLRPVQQITDFVRIFQN